MKLTVEQITYIENYIKSFNIKYYEVYMEILDHMILSVEEILANDSEISFEDAVLKAKTQDFGKNGFKIFSEENLQIFREKERTTYRNEIKKFFTFPKFVLTLTGFIGFAVFLDYFEKPKKIVMFIILFFTFIAFYQLKYWYKNRKIDGYKLIKNEFYGNGFYSVQLWIHFLNFFDDKNDSIYARLFFSIMTVLSFLSLLIFIKTRKIIDIEIKTYQLL
jgi:hypothetical protein